MLTEGLSGVEGGGVDLRSGERGEGGGRGSHRGDDGGGVPGGVGGPEQGRDPAASGVVALVPMAWTYGWWPRLK